jgi:arylsulfatase A-like enzyme
MSGRIQNTFGTRQNGAIWGIDPMPLNIPTIAERLVNETAYRTGMIGKWHLNPHGDATPGVDYPGVSDDYDPEDRGFQEYWRNSTSPYVANYDLAGNSLSPDESITDSRNRVIVQGLAAEAFIERNVHQPFFLYLSLFGPHLPRMSTTDPYYLNFPVLDYPNYNAEMDDIRRLGLGLVHAIDDAVGGVMQKLRDLGIEENTLILFSGDNGAQPKFFNGVGNNVTLESWTGNENLPLRGEKGSLWEGGIKVPMLAYWKGTIPAGQVIDEPIWTLDFTATALKLAGGTVPAEFDGVDILPRLKGEESTLARSKPMFWDWGSEIAIRKGEWKFIRKGTRKNLFNLARDPMELYDVQSDYPSKFAELEAELMAWYNALPPEGQSPLNGDGIDFYVTGNTSSDTDARYILPFTDGTPAAYPAPLQYGTPTYDSDGDTQSDWNELLSGTDPSNASHFFQIENSTSDPDGSFTMEVNGKAGRNYRLWQSGDLLDWNPVDSAGPLASDGTLMLTDPGSAPPTFYRVEVSD